MDLLDINVLVARLDPWHEYHARVAPWMARNAAAGWATCPLTENGVVRILGHPSYPNGPGSPEKAAQALRRLITSVSGHQFWPDGVSLLEPGTLSSMRGVTSAMITDLYLLALAVRQAGRFVTMDQRIDPSYVPGGPAALLVLNRR